MTGPRLRDRLSAALDRLAPSSFRKGVEEREQRELANSSLELHAARAQLGAAGASQQNVILCGCPRSGTSLLAAALFQPPEMVTVMEPWIGLRETPLALFASLRKELESGRLPSTRLDLRALSARGHVAWNEGDQAHRVDSGPRSLLGVKWPCYWQLLGASTAWKFIVCVRDPAAVVSSMGRQKGRLRLGLDYDVPFNRGLNQRLLLAHEEDERRRIAHFDEVYGHALEYAEDRNVLFARYERSFEAPTTLLEEISSFLDRDLTRTHVRVQGAPEPVLAKHGSTAAEIRAMSRTSARLGYHTSA